MTEAFPPGALLRDPRSPDAFDLRVVSSDDKFLVVSVGCDTRRYIRREALLRRWLLPARTAVAIAPVADEVTRVGMVIGLRGEPDSANTWTYFVDTDSGPEELPE